MTAPRTIPGFVALNCTTCICGYPGLTYAGPERECPVHGEDAQFPDGTTADFYTAEAAERDVPCCDYRDHYGDPEVCPCPEHPRSALHFLGHDPARVAPGSELDL